MYQNNDHCEKRGPFQVKLFRSGPFSSDRNEISFFMSLRQFNAALRSRDVHPKMSVENYNNLRL